MKNAGRRAACKRCKEVFTITFDLDDAARKVEAQEYLDELHERAEKYNPPADPPGWITTGSKADQLTRSNSERAETLGPNLDALVTELRDCDNERAMEIGRLLNDAGGMTLMRSAFYRVNGDSALERSWNGIGDWQS